MTLSTILIVAAHFVPSYGWSFDLTRVGSKWKGSAPGGQNCGGHVNMAVDQSSTKDKLMFSGRADSNNGQNCGGTMIFTVTEVKSQATASAPARHPVRRPVH